MPLPASHPQSNKHNRSPKSTRWAGERRFLLITQTPEPMTVTFILRAEEYSLRPGGDLHPCKTVLQTVTSLLGHLAVLLYFTWKVVA